MELHQLRSAVARRSTADIRLRDACHGGIAALVFTPLRRLTSMSPVSCMKNPAGLSQMYLRCNTPERKSTRSQWSRLTASRQLHTSLHRIKVSEKFTRFRKKLERLRRLLRFAVDSCLPFHGRTERVKVLRTGRP